ncbi:hypothetical protein HE1_00089 [Holospora elegans E1]|uniref:Uncharacterized protein n=1 Tax=Holospora elegans E1 TaxID=1427503 RepID=A0A023DXV9_9PROT|nr:hypothetical protein HE1_00089 [Holospora elegans E1]
MYGISNGKQCLFKESKTMVHSKVKVITGISRDTKDASQIRITKKEKYAPLYHKGVSRKIKNSRAKRAPMKMS